MTKLILSATSLLALSAAGAMAAPTWDGALTLGYASSDNAGGTADTLSLDGSGRLDFGSGFTLDLDLTLMSVEVDEETATAYALGVAPKYHLGSGLVLGGYLETGNLSGEGLSAEGSDDTTALTSFGLSGGYESEAMDLEVYLGSAIPGGALADPGDDLGVLHYGAAMTLRPTERLSIAGALQFAEYDPVEGRLNVHSIGLAANYALTDQLGIFGAAQVTSVQALATEIRQLGLGVSYEVQGAVPMVLSAEVARLSTNTLGSNGEAVDTIRVGLTIPLGGKSNALPQNSLPAGVFNPGHDPLVDTIRMAF